MVMAVSWLALTAPPVKGDIGVVGVSPRHANPGEEVNVSIGSGTSISSPTGEGPFPVSLVPLADTPRPHRCDSSGVIAPIDMGNCHAQRVVLCTRDRMSPCAIPERGSAFWRLVPAP